MAKKVAPQRKKKQSRHKETEEEVEGVEEQEEKLYVECSRFVYTLRFFGCYSTVLYISANDGDFFVVTVCCLCYIYNIVDVCFYVFTYEKKIKNKNETFCD